MTWSLYKGDEFLEPLKFSNGKTQEDIVKEVLDAISEGNKIIFIHGMCGTGKSAIALHLAKKLGKTSIVVPGKNLQRQYQKDYEKLKYLLKDNNEKLKISVITGRRNHKCKFLEDNKMAIPKVERNLSLHDIFSDKRKEIEELSKDLSSDNPNIPCKIEIKEKNWGRIKNYIKQNSKVKINDFNSIKDVRRMSIAPVCPYWSPVLIDSYDFQITSNKKKYKGLSNLDFIFHERTPGCSYYEQFNSYINSDVIVFNSRKYILESLMDRKPLTEVEIIDECDEFLDSFSNQRRINIDRLHNALAMIPYNEDCEKEVEELMEIINHLKRNREVANAVQTGEIIPLKRTGVYDLFKILLNSKAIFEIADEESYVFDAEEIARMFKGFFEDSYVIFFKKEDSLRANIVTTNLSKRFEQLADKNKVFVMMSGTLHSEKVLREIFGLQDFKVIEAETEEIGEMEVVRTGHEMDCKYSNFSCGKYSKEDYYKTLNECVKVAEKPCVVHVGSFQDLPSISEIEKLNLKNLISREELIQMQDDDKSGLIVSEFKNKEKEVLFSTRISRGIDFPGEQCRSIIFTKYPNPNIQDAFWKILNKTNPMYYWDFYKDKARRELLQRVYRGLRFRGDKVQILSPDVRVLNFFDGN